MNASRVLMSSLAALSMVVAAAAAHAGTTPSSARKLALAGAQAADACVSRAGHKGKWRLDDAGKWLRCPPRPVGPNVAGSNRFLPLFSGGALAATISSFNAFGDGQPSSP